MMDYLNYIIALGAFVGILLAVRYVVENQRSYPFKAKLERGQRKALQSFIHSDDFHGAGDLAFQYKAYEDSADLFIKAEDFIRAAEAYEQAGRRMEAITYYKKAAMPEKAAKLFEHAGQFRSAANEYVRAGKAEKAAELFMEARDFRAAAEAYQDMHDWYRAGEAYERLGLKDDMSEMFLRYFEEQFNLVRGNLADIPKARKAARQVAIYYHEQGRPVDAAQVLAQAGYLDEAAKLMARTGDIAAAAQLFMEAGNPLDAARLYEATGNESEAAYYRGEAALMNRNLEGAAAEFARAGEYQRAADLYAEAHNPTRAAELYEQLGDYRTAAELYSLGDNLQRAALCYEEGGEYQRAAEVFHEIGDIESEIRVLAVAGRFFSLGELLLELNRPDDALAAFQKVDSIDLRYPEACEAQGDILCERKQFEVASLKYRQAVQNREPHSGNLKIFYKMARALEALGDSEKLGEALKIYDGIVAAVAGHVQLVVGESRVAAGVG
ncbi:MAG: tetratricopeptide repeat protein, partial [Myxococcota bacterium]